MLSNNGYQYVIYFMLVLKSLGIYAAAEEEIFSGFQEACTLLQQFQEPQDFDPFKVVPSLRKLGKNQAHLAYGAIYSNERGWGLKDRGGLQAFENTFERSFEGIQSSAVKVLHFMNTTVKGIARGMNHVDLDKISPFGRTAFEVTQSALENEKDLLKTQPISKRTATPEERNVLVESLVMRAQRFYPTRERLPNIARALAQQNIRYSWQQPDYLSCDFVNRLMITAYSLNYDVQEVVGYLNRVTKNPFFGRYAEQCLNRYFKDKIHATLGWFVPLKEKMMVLEEKIQWQEKKGRKEEIKESQHEQPIQRITEALHAPVLAQSNKEEREDQQDRGEELPKTRSSDDIITIQVQVIHIDASALFQHPPAPLPSHVKVVGYSPDDPLNDMENSLKKEIGEILKPIQNSATPCRQAYHKIHQFVEQGKWVEAFNLMKENALFDQEDPKHPGTQVLEKMKLIPQVQNLVKALFA